MKNKNSFILALILVCVFAIGVFIFAGGVKGMSAYELAVLNGYVGTEQEWLASLQGSDGKDGESIDYAAMYEDYKESDEYVAGTTYLQFIQMLINADTDNGRLYATQESIMSSVGIFCFATGAKPTAGSGSFFKIESDGTAYVVTNFHVTYTTNNTTKYYILLYEDNYMTNLSDTQRNAIVQEKGLEASYIGGSKEHDLAVLKIGANTKLKDRFEDGLIRPVSYNLNIANCVEDVAVGTACYAVGNAMGEGIAVSEGVVSLISENVVVEDVEYSGSSINMRIMRTTCLINGGNSGGGLFDNSGNLIGVMNSKREYMNTSSTTDIDGVTYAIPLSTVVNVYNKIIAECNGTTITKPTFYNDSIGINTEIIDSKIVYNDKTALISTEETVKVSSLNTLCYAAVKGLKVDDILNSISIDYADSSRADLTNIKIDHTYVLDDLLLSVSSGDKIYISYTRSILGSSSNGTIEILIP